MKRVQGKWSQSYTYDPEEVKCPPAQPLKNCPIGRIHEQLRKRTTFFFFSQTLLELADILII